MLNDKNGSKEDGKNYIGRSEDGRRKIETVRKTKDKPFGIGNRVSPFVGVLSRSIIHPLAPLIRRARYRRETGFETEGSQCRRMRRWFVRERARCERDCEGEESEYRAQTSW